jgi:hypothetical protein
MTYLLTAIGLSPGGSTHLHKNNTWKNTNNNRTTQITTNVEISLPSQTSAIGHKAMPVLSTETPSLFMYSPFYYYSSLIR